MSENTSRPSRSGAGLVYLVIFLVLTGTTAGVTALLMNIQTRKHEGEQRYLPLAELTEETVDPAVWGTIFPRQFDSYKRTVDTERTRHGGSEAFNRLEADPLLKQIFAGYAFALDYREERGHAYMLSDQDITERTHKVKQAGACLHCHSSVIPAYRKLGHGDVMQGFEKMCAMPLAEARQLVHHPVTCLDCHDPKTLQLRVTRPGFINGIRALAESADPVPHLPSIQRWRKEKGKKPYDPNVEATRQELRSFVCGQCHVEYYFKGAGKVVTYPWAKGLLVENIEAYYDEANFADWKHALSGAGILKAQHPEFELWSQGTHARAGVACADCHMPYIREGALKVSDHQVRSPLLNVARACQVCHRAEEKEMLARAQKIQDRNKALLDRTEVAVVDLITALKSAGDQGVSAEQLQTPRKLHRRAQWRLDFVNAENSMGFHAPQEAARILGEAIDLARQGQIEVLKRSGK